MRKPIETESNLQSDIDHPISFLSVSYLVGLKNDCFLEWFKTLSVKGHLLCLINIKDLYSRLIKVIYYIWTLTTLQNLSNQTEVNWFSFVLFAHRTLYEIFKRLDRYDILEQFESI